MTILFTEENHKYFIKEKPDFKFVSISGLINLIKQEFDTKTEAKKYSEKGKDKILKDLAKKWGLSTEEATTKWGHLEMTPEDIEAIWLEKKDTSLVKGTTHHIFREDQSIRFEGGYPILYDGDIKQAYPLRDLKPGLYPELIIHNLEYGLIGTADRIKIYPDKTFEVFDYKGLALDTPIATSVGWKLMGEITTDDYIFDGAGSLTKVKNVSEIHYNPCYKITFDTNDTIICDHEHRWIIEKSNFYKKVSQEFELTTEEIAKQWKSSKKPLSIPCVTLQMPHIDLPIDPYILGLWLGDGNNTCGTLTCVNDKIWKEIENRGYSTSINHNRNYEKAESRTIFGLATGLRSLNLLHNKHVPDIYLRSSYEQRLDLLRGFMDADGHYNKSRKRCVMVTTKEWQANGLMKICSSLGIKSTKIKATTSGFGKSNIPCFHINFSSIVSPFLVRNVDYNLLVTKNSAQSKRRYIKNIELIETVPTKCIEVESETHCYLAGHNLIKTHNTNQKIEFQGFKKYDKTLGFTVEQKLKRPVNHLSDSNGIKYTIQLSCYAYMLEQFGYTCKGLTLNHVILDADGNLVNEIDYKLDYLKKEVVTLFNWFKKQ